MPKNRNERDSNADALFHDRVVFAPATHANGSTRVVPEEVNAVQKNPALG